MTLAGYNLQDNVYIYSNNKCMCVFLISPVPITEPLTSELIDTPVFYNLAPRPIKYRVSVPIPSPTRAWEFTVLVKSCRCFVDQTGHRLERVSRWMDSRSVPNAECAATGGQAKVKTRIAVHQRLPRLKQRAAPHVMHIKDPTLRNIFFLKMVSMNSSTLFLV